MLKKLAMSVAAVALLATSSIAADNTLPETPPVSIEYQNSQISLEKKQKQMLDATVQIGDYCTGFVIFSGELNGVNTNVILTAKHCSKAKKSNRIETVEVKKEKYTESGENVGSVSYIGHVVRVDHNSDIMMVVLNDPTVNLPTVKIADEDMSLPIGTKVWAAGYPLGLGMSLTEGTLGETIYVPEGTIYDSVSSTGRFRRVNINIDGGSSGGPLFALDKNGDYVVVGLATGMIGTNGFVGIYTTIEDLLRVIPNTML